jgi:hypothetical protein
MLFLLVYSDKLGIDMLLAEGRSNDTLIHALQPNHLASVGKLFAATLIGILFDQGKLDYHDPIARYLDAELMKGLACFKGDRLFADNHDSTIAQTDHRISRCFFPFVKTNAQGRYGHQSPRCDFVGENAISSQNSHQVAEIIMEIQTIIL